MYFNFYKLFFGRTHTSFWLIEWNGYDTSQTPLLSLVLICRRATCDMTPTELPVLSAIPFRYEYRSRRQQPSSISVFTAGMPAKLTELDFAGMPAVKTCGVS